ncbi:MAG: ABC transporter substrate-binding protein [Deltaproteobacteria bacterium]|nr:ABC transporter substrate-binding protein [Deltaproteobacteria bacterium]
MKNVFSWIIIISLMLAADATNLWAVPTAGASNAVTIGVAQSLPSAPILIAIENGYFSDAGLSVKVREYAYGKVAMVALLKGEVSLVTAGDLPVVLHSFERSDFVILAMYAFSHNHSKLISRKDRGITKPSDLKGKKVGLPFGTTTQYFLDTFLNANMISPADLKMLNVPANELPAALADGKVDAIADFEPYAYQATILLKGSAYTFPKTGLYRETFNLVAMKEFLLKEPESAIKLLRAVDRAEAFIRTNRKEAIAIISRKLGIEQQFLLERWEDYSFALVLDQALLMSLEDVARWAIRSKQTGKKNVPNYLRYIYQDALRAVKPENLRIFSK